MRREAVTAGVLLLAFAVGTGAAGEETYVGTVTIGQEGAKAGSVPLTLTVRKDTSDERANALAALLHDRGYAAAFAELSKDDVGQLRLGDKATFRATVIRREPTANGHVLRVMTDRPVYVGENRPDPAPPADAVGYLELTLGSAGTGEGRLMPAVKAKFDSEGFIGPDSVGGSPWVVSNVTRKP